MAAPIEQDVILDADGKSLISAFEYVQREIASIQKAVKNIGRDSYKSAEDFGKALAARTKELQTALSQMRTLSGPGSFAGDFEAAMKKQRDDARAFFAQTEADRKASIRRQVAEEREGARIIADQNRTQAQRDADVSKLRLNAKVEATRAEIRENARAITSENELANARATNVSKLREYRAAARSETDPAQLRALQQLIQLERERGTVLEQTARRMEAANRRLEGLSQTRAKSMLTGQVIGDIRTDGLDVTRARLLREQQEARDRLSSATNTKDIAAAQKVLDLANARLAVVERISRAERTADTRAQKSTAGSFARDEISAVGQAAALAAAKLRQVIAEQSLKNATVETRVEAQRVLDIENARLRATERIVREQQKETGGKGGTGAGVPEKTPLQNILSPGYALAAFARTSVYGAAAAAAYGAFNAVQSSVSNIILLEDEMGKLQAISNSTDTQMQSLKASIYAIGQGSRYAVNDLVKISHTLAQAGVSANDMEKVLRAVTTLATASGSSPDEAVGLVTAALGSFQLQATEASRVADLMTNALNRTRLTVNQVALAIQYVGATAYEQNISLEQMLATVGAIAQGGVRSGSTIGTGFRQFLVDLQTPSEKLTFQLERLGITQADVDVRTRGLAAVLETLKEKGFDASQAYQGLETRAAAFYLVAKHNVDVMDDLQLSFAMSGAAAVANERAMNTLTAQWQRFKNILQQGLASSMDETMQSLTNILRNINDKLVEMQNTAANMAVKSRADDATYGTGWNRFKHDPMNYDFGPMLESGLESGLNALGTQGRSTPTWLNPFKWLGLESNKGLGTWLKEIDDKADGAGARVAVFATQIQNASDAVDTHSASLTAADQEIARLKTQQSSLINNTTRTAAETVTLTARFKGLVGYLGQLENGYLDLVNAMQQYRGEESRFLADSYEGLRAAQIKQNNLDRGDVGTTRQQILNNPLVKMGGVMTPGQIAILNNPADSRFVATFTELAEDWKISNRELSDLFATIAQLVSRLQQGERTEVRAGQQAGLARSAATPLGVESNDRISTFTTRLESLEALPQAQRNTQGTGLTADINRYRGLLQERLPKLSGSNKDFIEQQIRTLDSLLQQITAALKPTAGEIQTANRERTEQNRREAELRRRPVISQTDIDSVGTGLGLRLGSGTRTPAEQEALFRRGVTRARGSGPGASNHVTGVARDFQLPSGTSDADAERLATTLRAQYRAKGITVQVIYERGGPNQGTGRHIHVGARHGERFSRDKTEEQEDRYDNTLDRAQLDLYQDQLRIALKDIGRSTTKEAFDGAIERARSALTLVNNQLKNNALNDLASEGIMADSVQGKARMAQVTQQIEQNVDEFRQKLTDGLIKAVDKMLSLAEQAFKRAMQPSERLSQLADARLSGLDLYSNRGRVPDYVRATAERRSAEAKETTMRAQVPALDDQIATNSKAMSDLIDTLDNPDVDTEAVNARIDALALSIQNLKTQRDALVESLGSGGLVPTSIGDGLDMAIANWKAANNASMSLKDSIIMNLGGAIDTIQGGLTEMFTGIFNGSQTALQAFGNFAKGIMNYIAQIAAKFVATQLMNQFMNLFSAASGGGGGGSGDDVSKILGLFKATGGLFGGGSVGDGEGPTFGGGSQGNKPWVLSLGGRYEGGPAVEGLAGGGKVSNGDENRDSVYKKLAKGEWVVRKRAVDSVGNQFMARLNAHGAAAVAAQSNMPVMPALPKQEMAVYVVSPEQKPSLSKNDVLVTLHEDILGGGETKKLIKYVAQGG